jgi:Mg-chelatase subunit ChlD
VKYENCLEFYSRFFSAKQTKHHWIEGVYIVFCIDTSASMKSNNAFHHANMFVTDFLSGKTC